MTKFPKKSIAKYTWNRWKYHELFISEIIMFKNTLGEFSVHMDNDFLKIYKYKCRIHKTLIDLYKMPFE